MRALSVYVLILALGFQPAFAAESPDPGDCARVLVVDQGLSAFLADPRINWTGREQGHRLPPDIFGSAVVAYIYPYMKRLPDGLSSQEQTFYQMVFDLLRDHQAVFRMLKDLESDLARMTGGSGDFEARRKALYALLTAYEKDFGFPPATQLTGRMDSADFLRVIAAGQTFVDLEGHKISVRLNAQFRAQKGRWVHGRLTHRLQWHLVLRHLTQHPELVADRSAPLRFYRLLGDPSHAARLDWSKTGVPDGGTEGDQRRLYVQLFDSPENNGSSPGFYLEYRQHWPGLPIE